MYLNQKYFEVKAVSLTRSEKQCVAQKARSNNNCNCVKSVQTNTGKHFL